MATPHAMKARGAAAPNDCAINAGNAKILAPIVVLMMLAASPGTPMARSSWASAFSVFSGITASKWSFARRETSLSKCPVAKPALVGLICDMRDSYLEEYYSFLRFPSVSTDQAFAGKVTECAQWLVKKLQTIGLETQLVPTAGHPVVWARNKQQPGRRTVMIYGHYDVQPPDPLDLWESPPFEPVLKNGYVFARGATDNKGQILSHILGVQETIEKDSDLPVNLHFVIEGEEEIGSGNLPKFLSDNRDALKCDVAVVSDTGMVAKGVPTLSYGLRGVTACEVKITSAKMDLHSGVFGGAVANPITALARLLATLHDENGHVAVAGFYDKVKPLEDWERKAWRELPIDGDKAILDETGAPALFGEAGYSTLERIWGRPTAEINGIGGGYQGMGTK